MALSRWVFEIVTTLLWNPILRKSNSPDGRTSIRNGQYVINAEELTSTQRGYRVSPIKESIIDNFTSHPRGGWGSRPTDMANYAPDQERAFTIANGVVERFSIWNERELMIFVEYSSSLALRPMLPPRLSRATFSHNFIARQNRKCDMVFFCHSLTVAQLLFRMMQQCCILCNFVTRMLWTLIGQFLFMRQSCSVRHAQLHCILRQRFRAIKLRDKIAGVASV